MESNVLYIFADQLSMMALDRFGYPQGANTPNINRLADNGVRFVSSYCSTPQCSASRSSILTGLYPHKTKVVGNVGTPGTESLSPLLPSMGHYFKDRGYATAYFGKWHLSKSSIGLYGFDHLSEAESKKKSNNKQHDDQATNEMLNFLDSRRALTGQPWLAIVSYFNPHDIYAVKTMIDNNIPLNLDQIKLPSSFADSLTDKPKAQVEFRDHDQGERTKLFTEDDWKYYIAYYNYLVEYIDSQLGLITDKLRSIGQLDNTLIVFTSDHGDMLSAHRTPFKGPMMYDELVKIPVIFSWPDRIPNGEERTQLMLNTDHFPTICDLLNFPVPNMIDGVSMKEVIYQRDIPSRDSIVLQYYSKQKWVNPIRSVVQRDFKYSLYLSGEEELYHTAEDPGELHNVAESSTYAAKKSQMKQMLLQWIQDEADPFFTYTRTDRGGVPVT